MIESVWSEFHDVDGNFAEQFQTTAFDARLWELYLHAALSSIGYPIRRPIPGPDFVVNAAGRSVFIEAVTSNPSRVQPPFIEGWPRALTEQEIETYQNSYIPVRLGSSLSSKLARRYWRDPQVAASPLVLALEAFHGPEALAFDCSALNRYLFGVAQRTGVDGGGRYFEWQMLDEHVYSGKRIPSGFFRQRDAAHVSAVLFSNSGTTGKFKRMGVQTGQYVSNLRAVRRGWCYDPDPEVFEPRRFEYSVGDPDWTESWSQGLFMIHNPWALHPIDPPLFPGFSHVHLQSNNLVRFDLAGFVPITSFTDTFVFEGGAPSEFDATDFRLLNCE